MKATLNADNLLLSGTRELMASPTNEIVRAMEDVGLSAADVRKLLFNACTETFNVVDCTPAWRAAFLSDVDAAIEAFNGSRGEERAVGALGAVVMYVVDFRRKKFKTIEKMTRQSGERRNRRPQR